jgi:signal transduction histidine kinase
MEGGDDALMRGIARGIVVYRWLTLGWAWIGLFLQRSDLEHAVLAILGLLAASAVTIAATVIVAADARRAFAPAFIAFELAVGAGLLLLDGVVYDPSRSQSLPWAWPGAGVISAAVAGGAVYAVASALGMALASFLGESILRGHAEWTVSSASKSALFLLAGLAAARVAGRLREAEAQIASARARDEVARTLHDGVLQTLAVIQRRSDDDFLRALARDQERDLRAYLFGRRRDVSDLATELRAAGDTAARRFDIEPQIVLADDLPALDPSRAGALAGAVTEALTNAAKHSGAERIVVFAEPTDVDGEVFCTIRDNGTGFDAARTASGEGISRSIRQRIAEVGGRVEIDSRPGRGTEVRLWVR